MDIYPFGKSEGAYEEFSRLIEFNNALAWGGLHLDPSDLQIRIVVGKKGSGKTFYLRIMEDHTVRRDDIICFQPNRNRVDPNLVLRFSACLDDGILSSAWQTLWRRAFFFSICTHFFAATPHHVVQEYSRNSSSFKKTVNEYRSHFLKEHAPRFRDLQFDSPIGIFGSASYLTNIVDDSDSFHEVANTSRWNQLESFLTGFMNSMPTIAYFLDSIDQDFRHAPAAYLDCQKGLYYAVRELLETNVFRNKLHVVITIRDLVFSAVCFSEHKTKQFADPHIRAMNWDKDSASYFFDKKIEDVHRSKSDTYRVEDFFVNSSKKNSLIAWLGFEAITNSERNVTESAKDYIIRHTHAMPREIVVICNQVSIEIAKCHELKLAFSPERFKRVVNSISSDFSEELLKVCANYVASSSVTKEFLFDSYEPAGSFETIASDHYYQLLTKFINDVGTDTFTYEQLIKVLEQYQVAIEEGAEKTKYHLHRIENVLWQQGLIGYREFFEGGKKTIDHFYTDDLFKNDFFLPKERQLYVFHPGLIGLTNIKPTGDRPVGGVWAE